MKTALALAASLSAAVLLAAVLAPPAAAEPAIGPDKPGIWGFTYDEEVPGQAPQQRAAGSWLSCLAEPALLEPTAAGYRVSVYTIDAAALAANEVRYFLRSRSDCVYEAASGIEGCSTGEGDPYWTFYEPLDVGAGIYRGHGLADVAAVDAVRASGKPPAESWPFLVFYCPKELRPRFAFLQAAIDDRAGEEGAYEALAINLDDCGQPLCGLDAERLRQLAGH